MRDDFSFEDLDFSLSSLTANALIISIRFPHFRRIAIQKHCEKNYGEKAISNSTPPTGVFEWFLTLSQRCLLRLLLFQSKSRCRNTFRDSLTGGPFCSYSMVLSVSGSEDLFLVPGSLPNTAISGHFQTPFKGHLETSPF